MLTPEDTEQAKNATPEQKKEIAKVLSKARLRLFGIGAKFSLGLFGSNFLTIAFGAYFLKDVDPEAQIQFQFVAMIVNFIFMSMYLNGQIKQHSDIVVSKIKEILKK